MVCFLPISTGLAQNPLQLFHILQSQIPGILLFESQAAQDSQISPLPAVFGSILSQWGELFLPKLYFACLASIAFQH